MLLLPDGDDFLEAIDALESGFEGGTPVRRGDDDGNAGLADQHPSQAMHHGDALHLMRGGDFAADLRHHLQRHGLVALVIQKAGGASLGVVADGAFEGDHGALGAGEEARDYGSRIDGVPGQGEIVAGFPDVRGRRYCARR